MCFFNMTNVTQLKILLFLSPYNFKAMKKLFITLISVIAFSGYSFGQATAPATAAPAADKDAPEIVFTSTEHDFGTVTYDGNGTYKFEFKNTGKKPLLLSDVHATCGCTTPEWPKDPIKKGEKAVITVKYNTKIVGSFTKNVFVTSNAKTAKVTLTIKGTVAPAEQKKEGNS
jgi:hypothetical protein